MRRRGANATEFALLLPAFVALIAGAMELSWMFYQHGALRTAVSHGCRAGAMLDPGRLEDQMDTVASAARNAVVDEYEWSVGRCPSCVSTAVAVGTPPTRSLTCTLRAPYVSLTRLLGDRSGTMEDSVTMRMEFQRRLDR